MAECLDTIAALLVGDLLSCLREDAFADVEDAKLEVLKRRCELVKKHLPQLAALVGAVLTYHK